MDIVTRKAREVFGLKISLVAQLSAISLRSSLIEIRKNTRVKMNKIKGFLRGWGNYYKYSLDI